MATPNKHPKQALQEYAQKRHLGLPKYSHEVEGKQGGGKNYSVKAIVLVGDHKFESERFFSNKKEADRNVAVVALNLLTCGPPSDNGQQKGQVKDSTPHNLAPNQITVTDIKPSDQPTAGSSQNSFLVQCANSVSENPKTLLSNLIQKQNLMHPVYQCKSMGHGKGFVCAATFNGKEFKSEEIFPKRKLAELRAAALILDSLEHDQTNPKTLLGNRASKLRVMPPVYNCRPVGKSKYKCTATFIGKEFRSDDALPSRKMAEFQVARYILDYLDSNTPSIFDMPVQRPNIIERPFEMNVEIPNQMAAQIPNPAQIPINMPNQMAVDLLNADSLPSAALGVELAMGLTSLIANTAALLPDLLSGNPEPSENVGLLGNSMSPQASQVLPSRFDTPVLPHPGPSISGQCNMTPGHRLMPPLSSPMAGPQLRTPGLLARDHSFVPSQQMIGPWPRTPELPHPGRFMTPPQMTSPQSRGTELPSHDHNVRSSFQNTMSGHHFDPRFKTPDISVPDFHGTLSRNTWASSSQITDTQSRTPEQTPPAHVIQSTLQVTSSVSRDLNLGVGLTPSSKVLSSECLTPQSVFLEMSYKSFLQEYLQQRGMKTPKYETRIKGCGYTSSVKFCDRTVSCEGVFTTKKTAEQMAARRGLVAIGMKKPEELFKKRKGNSNKLKTLPFRPGERATWLHQHVPDTPHSSGGTKQPGEEFDDEENPQKRARLDWEGELPPECKKNLSVGEIWQEKGNVAIVGDENCSFILRCSRSSNSLALFCKKTSEKVLKPGHCLIGLDAKCIKYQGKIALEAAQCMDIIFPDPPNPVLVSCGVTILYHDKEASTDIQVLLKRYLCSGAFVNVAAELARYLRCLASDRPSLLLVDKVITNIKDWMPQEVEWIAMMNEDALRKVFCHMWKFSNKWSEFLQPDTLPFELQKLQAIAKDELARRKVTAKKLSEEHYHPWGLPKGNFGHKAFSTGLHIESPADCAARELREETGILLEPFQLDNVPFVDIPQTQNFNPHRGDVMRFYLYVFKPDPSTEFSESFDTSHQLDSSIQSEEGGSFIASEKSDIVILDGGENSVDAVTTDTGNQSEQETCSDKNRFSKADSGVIASNSTGRDTTYHEEGSAVDKLQNSNVDSGGVKRLELEGDVDMKRGQKRKRDSESDRDSEAPQQKRVLGLASTPESSAQITASTPLTHTRQSIGSTTPGSVRSPRVQGGVHEECAWFTVGEARQKSPLFDQIYNTSQFAEVLASIGVEKS